jgi:hypothetical protein
VRPWPEFVFVVSIYRRYHELCKTLDRLHELSPLTPVILIRAAPEPSLNWLFQGLEYHGWVTHILDRAEVPREGGATTYLESLNIRASLDFAATRYPTRWAFYLAGDVCVHPFGLEFLEDALRTSARLACCHWGNGSRTEHVYHTNFFGVPLYYPITWPPLSPPDHADVLEVQWGDYLRNKGINPNLTTNAAGRVFAHEHRSESLLPFPASPCSCSSHIPGLTLGKGPPGPWGRLLRSFLFWRK